MGNQKQSLTPRSAHRGAPDTAERQSRGGHLGRAEREAGDGQRQAASQDQGEGNCPATVLRGTLRRPGRRIGQRGDATRAPTQGPRPERAARSRPTAYRDWPVDVHTPKANVQYRTLDRKPLKSVRNRHQTNTILNTSHEPKSTTVLELKYRSYEMFTIIQEFTEKYRGFRGSLFRIHPLSGCERLPLEVIDNCALHFLIDLSKLFVDSSLAMILASISGGQS